MRVVIDTNVLVSAILRDRAPEAVILFITERLIYHRTSYLSQNVLFITERPDFE
jgi:predicted nucleic acid-binding protein